MVSIGMLHYRKNPEEVKKAYAFAAVSKMEEVDFSYFSYGCVDFEQRKINGWVHDSGKWVQKEIEFPEVIINISSPRTKRQSAIKNKLKDIAIFTSYPVGNKLYVYNKILNGEKFAEYLIPSTQINRGQDVLPFFQEYQKLVIKPLSGNHGNGVMFIEKISDDSYQLTDGTVKKIYKEKLLTVFINRLIRERKYLLQPFIECKTRAGLTYDFRLHVQKIGNGEWEINLIYPRISGNSKMISNINRGGYRGELVPFLIEEFGNEHLEIKELLEQFALAFSTHFDTLYDHRFDELGIDVGIDKDRKLWIFEVNWRPGSKHREFEVAKRLIPYCIYLANRRSDPSNKGKSPPKLFPFLKYLLSFKSLIYNYTKKY
ncbi:YheC/YheD family protein [Lederbergia citri]|uniref:YheC/YheD family protein n=1 Tax=Lederbergia citri TaxID=2833580 RepID=A0A942TEX4_9BACI|nr:YheC/YheD family protein [Lederbergia citri]MBS4194924.1 YheC/YheD family protein [Lederbergia citri]